MSLWQQHYYTWSTRSLSGNKVGLGIVAASDKDRDYLRIAGTEGAKCDTCTTEEGLMVERFGYSSELHGFIRTGTVPCEQAADRRNNKFVHIQSCVRNDFSDPENYLCPLTYETQWDGKENLTPIFINDKKEGRAIALAYLKKYGLEKRISFFFYDVYHCMFTSEKPLLIVDERRTPRDFADFSREMMILIHYMLPESLRKEADYVSFVTEKTQEAHFLFGKESITKQVFSLQNTEVKKEYVLLEKEFFEKLATAFLEKNDEFEQLTKQIDAVLLGLNDKRNQLEKCIFSLMASSAGKEKKKDNFFGSMERLMYWARKDKSLIKPLKDSIQDLDFQSMNEEELLSYTKLMLTGAGGETKTFVLQELNRMLRYYDKDDRICFKMLITYIRDNHGGIYEEVLKKNNGADGFTEKVLFEPVDSEEKLKNAVKYHKSFFNKKEYQDYLVKSAYELYKKNRDGKKQLRLGELGKIIDEEAFVDLKLRDVEKVIKQADSLQDFINIVSKMNMDRLEEKIRTFLFEKSVLYMKKEKKLDHKEEDELRLFARNIEMTDEMEEAIRRFYESELDSFMKRLTPSSIIKSADVTREESLSERTSTYLLVRNQLLAKKYHHLVKMRGSEFYELDTCEWVCFVLQISERIKKSDRKQASKMIQDTKNLILKSNNIFLLAEVNRTLKMHGTAPIHCTESMWKQVKLESAQDLAVFFEKVEDLSLVRCENNFLYRDMKEIYEYADARKGDLTAKATFAWKKYKRMQESDGNHSMDDNRFTKFIRYAVEDILGKSVWAVLLGFYGFLFVSIREKVAIMPGYGPSVILLILLVIVYGMKGLSGKRKAETPGAVLYVMGVGILLMNWGLALDTNAGVMVLYVTSAILAAAAKTTHYIFFRRQKDEAENED